MYGYIYKTTNLINGLIYVGQHKATKFEPNRYMGSGNNIKAAIKEFGKENFKCELLDTAETLEELNSKEEYWVDELQSRNPAIGYNVKKGGEQLGLTGCCKIRRGEETLVVERATVKTYLDEGWILTNTKETRAEKNKKYQKNYYEKNKEKCLAYGKTWRVENKEQMKDLQTNWYQQHATEESAKALQYYYSHQEERIEYQKEYNKKNPESKQQYYQANKEKYKQRALEWRKANPEKYKEIEQRRAEKLKAKRKAEK
jgi:hypothetical protein